MYPKDLAAAGEGQRVGEVTKRQRLRNGYSINTFKGDFEELLLDAHLD